MKIDDRGRFDRSFAGRGRRHVLAETTPVALFAHGERLLVVGQHYRFPGSAKVQSFDLDGARDRSFEQGATLAEKQRVTGMRVLAAEQPGGRLVLAGERQRRKAADGSRLELLGLR